MPKNPNAQFVAEMKMPFTQQKVIDFANICTNAFARISEQSLDTRSGNAPIRRGARNSEMSIEKTGKGVRSFKCIFYAPKIALKRLKRIDSRFERING